MIGESVSVMHGAWQSRTDFEKNGFVVIEGFASPDVVNALRQRAEQLVDGFAPHSQPKSVFTTQRHNHVGDDYFLGSGDKIRFFFEEGAFDSQGQLACDKQRAINKIGHALHELDPVFAAFSTSNVVRYLARQLGYRRPLLVQSMYIFKQPGIGGRVAPHQDSSFLYTEPLSCCGLWIALEDATAENGCLWVWPGSHRAGVHTRFVRYSRGAHPSGKQTVFDPPEVPAAWDTAPYVPIEVPRGACVVLHGSIVHKSEPNASARSRHAYTLHLIEGENTVYSDVNWLQRSDGRGFVPL